VLAVAVLIGGTLSVRRTACVNGSKGDKRSYEYFRQPIADIGASRSVASWRGDSQCVALAVHLR
jgi:hypothetical protein